MSNLNKMYLAEEEFTIKHKGDFMTTKKRNKETVLVYDFENSFFALCYSLEGKLLRIEKIEDSSKLKMIFLGVEKIDWEEKDI